METRYESQHRKRAEKHMRDTTPPPNRTHATPPADSPQGQLDSQKRKRPRATPRSHSKPPPHNPQAYDRPHHTPTTPDESSTQKNPLSIFDATLLAEISPLKSLQTQDSPQPKIPAYKRATEPLYINFAIMDEARVEPRGSYSKSSNCNLSFLPAVAQSRESDKEACVVIQVDDGASPSIMRADLARALGATLVPLEEPILIAGISGQMVVEYDTIIHIRLTGESLHHSMATTEGAYGIRFLVHDK